MHLIATAPRTDPETTTLLARRETWSAVLAELPDGGRDRTERIAWATVRQQITAALEAGGDVVRVTVSNAEADRLLRLAGLAP
jgi:hypothetical protein